MCKTIQLLDGFHKLKGGKMGRHSNCKKCRSNYQKTLSYDKPINGKLKCTICNQLKSVKEYYRNKISSTGLQSCCITCHKEKIYESQSKLIGYIKKELLKLNKQLSGTEINISDIIEIYDTQLGKCAISDELLTYYYGPKLTENKYESKYNIKLIKKNLDKPYEKNNIILIGDCIYKMKGNKDLNDLIHLCNLVCKKNNTL